MAGLGSLIGQALQGDWKKASAAFGDEIRAGMFLQKAKAKAMKRATAFAAGQIKRNLRSSGTLAGAPFKPLADSTIARRKKGRKKSMGHLPLLDTGDMMGSVHPHYVNENFAFAGIKRGAIGKKTGEPRIDIAMVHEYGTIKSKIVIPARPFVGPTLDKFAGEMGKIYAETLEKEFNDGKGPPPEEPLIEEPWVQG